MASYAVSYINEPQSVFALHNNENGRMGNKVEILYPLHFALKFITEIMMMVDTFVNLWHNVLRLSIISH